MDRNHVKMSAERFKSCIIDYLSSILEEDENEFCDAIDLLDPDGMIVHYFQVRALIKNKFIASKFMYEMNFEFPTSLKAVFPVLNSKHLDYFNTRDGKKYLREQISLYQLSEDTKKVIINWYFHETNIDDSDYEVLWRFLQKYLEVQDLDSNDRLDLSVIEQMNPDHIQELKKLGYIIENE